MQLEQDCLLEEGKGLLLPLLAAAGLTIPTTDSVLVHNVIKSAACSVADRMTMKLSS